MKKHTFLLILGLFIIKSYAQVPQTKSVTISPLAGNVEEVKGNIKATGIIESNTLKASGLSSGNPYVANPVYANLDGTLVTGYKTGYLGIPAIAFKLSDYVYIYNTEFTITPDGNDYLQFDGKNLTFINNSPNKAILAPIQVPHSSKLISMKISFSAYTDVPKSLDISIIRSNLLDRNNQTILHSFTTATTSTTQLVTEVIFPNNLEIDNQNYLYTIKVGSTLNVWNGVYFRGVVIEYRDF